MLAQNFKGAPDLTITDTELSALIKVLGMLERGDLIDVKAGTKCKNGFNIGTQGRGCGTPACIGGWVATLMKADQLQYVDSYLTSRAKGHGLSKLYWGYHSCPSKITTAEAAIALRNYLTTGDPKWHEAAE